MNIYEATFYKWEKTESGKKRLKYVGRTVINDALVNEKLPLAAKAFLHAPEGCKHADKVEFQRVEKFR